MRIYTDFNQARSEIERDLVEMGIIVHAKSWQDKDVSNDPNWLFPLTSTDGAL